MYVSTTDQAKKAPNHELIGSSLAFSKILTEGMIIAGIDVPVLISGETGTGKTQFAKLMHHNSLRKNGPFIHLNCANLPESLVESELFGARRGSHSGAHRDMPGKIAAASGGTLFLDEIGELPITIQAKFLQFVEEGFYFPLGANTPERPDVRIIAATVIDFDEAIRKKTFRADLYYRISVFSLEMPPLRDRRGDICELAHLFVKKYCHRFRMPVMPLPDDLTPLLTHPWPGNIRQLENAIQQAIILSYAQGQPLINLDELAQVSLKGQPDPAPMGTYREEKERWEKQLLASVLKQTRWNLTETARKLDLSRSHVNNMARRYNLVRQER